MSKPTLTNLMDIYDAWRDHDLDRLASYLPADFSHSLNIPCEMIAAGGMREGKAAAIARLQQIFEGFDTQHIGPGLMRPDETTVVLDVHTRCQHRLSGRWLDTTKKHVWVLEDGWPVSLSEFYDLEQFAAFMRTNALALKAHPAAVPLPSPRKASQGKSRRALSARRIAALPIVKSTAKFPPAIKPHAAAKTKKKRVS